MTGTSIIKAVRLNPTDFPNFCKITVNLYDSKDRIDTRDSVTYVTNLFAKNEEEGKKFTDWLKSLEKNPVSSINILINETHVAVFYKSSQSRIFSRMPSSMNDFNFMD